MALLWLNTVSVPSRKSAATSAAGGRSGGYPDPTDLTTSGRFSASPLMARAACPCNRQVLFEEGVVPVEVAEDRDMRRVHP